MTQAAMYVKHQSFNTFVSNIGASIEQQRRRMIEAVEGYLEGDDKREDVSGNYEEVLGKALADLRAEEAGLDVGEREFRFKVNQYVADEVSRLGDSVKDLVAYAYHRYRYDIYPADCLLDDYPPYIQIEPSSACNYRCVFCFQTDKTFSGKSSGHMGKMSLERYKQAVDWVEGKVAFGSLASRGEPLLNKDIGEVLAYSRGKFLGLKMNTNASLLTEEKAHAILSGGLGTVVFSADAAKEPDYSRFRVYGKLDRVLENINRFNQIRARDYPESRLITRVSGVMYDPTVQNMEEMVKLWGGLVEQVCFVKYAPWENVYEAEPVAVEKPCTELYRRMYVWHDGRVNPCETDYKSMLSVGSMEDGSLRDLWRSAGYEALRAAHQGKGDLGRDDVEPCARCMFT